MRLTGNVSSNTNAVQGVSVKSATEFWSVEYVQGVHTEMRLFVLIQIFSARSCAVREAGLARATTFRFVYEESSRGTQLFQAN
jgi:hypothetical protein